MLRAKNLSFGILKKISFDAEDGRITVVFGPNGSGKTTLFKCISGIWKAEGNIYWNEKDISNLDPKQRAKIISFVPQEHIPPFSYTVMDVVLMGRASHLGRLSSPRKKDYKVAEDAIKKVGIRHLRDRAYTRLSGGERQLTLIARAISQGCPLMILDEPVSHLDFRNQIRILNLIRRLSKDGVSILMSVHDPNIAMNFSDKVLVISEGKKIAEGRAKEVITEDLIKKIYGVDVSIIDIDGKRIITAKGEKDVFDNNMAVLLQCAS